MVLHIAVDDVCGSCWWRMVQGSHLQSCCVEMVNGKKENRPLIIFFLLFTLPNIVAKNQAYLEVRLKNGL